MLKFVEWNPDNEVTVLIKQPNLLCGFVTSLVLNFRNKLLLLECDSLHVILSLILCFEHRCLNAMSVLYFKQTAFVRLLGEFVVDGTKFDLLFKDL